MRSISINVYPGGNQSDVIAFSQTPVANNPAVIACLTANDHEIVGQQPGTDLDRYVRVRPPLSPQHIQKLVDVVFASLGPEDALWSAIDHRGDAPQILTPTNE